MESGPTRAGTPRRGAPPLRPPTPRWGRVTAVPATRRRRNGNDATPTDARADSAREQRGGRWVGHVSVGGRGAPNEARRVNGSGHARGWPSFPPPLLPDTASRRCLRPTDRATRRDPTAHAHAPTRGGRWPKRHAGGAANESAASGALASDPCGTPKNEGAATRRRAQKSGLGWSRSTCLQSCSLSHYIHCPGGSCGSTHTWLGVTARGSPRCCQPKNATNLI